MNEQYLNSTIEEVVGNEYLCENNNILQHQGSCEDDEVCTGPNKLREAKCGTTELCTKGNPVYSQLNKQSKFHMFKI